MNSTGNRVYFVYDNDRNATDIVRVNNNTRAWVRQKENGGLLVRQYKAEKASEILQENPGLYKILSSRAWETIAENMGNWGRPATTASMFSDTPHDLPASVASQRLNLMADHPSLRNPSAQRELTEIIMAQKDQRPVNPELFRPADSESYGWEASIARTSGSVENDKLEAIGEHQSVRKQNIETINNEGQLAPESAAQEALLLQGVLEADLRHQGQVELRERLGLDNELDDEEGFGVGPSM